MRNNQFDFETLIDMSNTSIRVKISTLNFLEFAAWGAWLISLGSYLGGVLHFTPVQIGSFYALQGIASLIMPTLMGIVADRWIQAQKVFGLCHLFAAVFLVAASFMTTYAGIYPMMLGAVLFFMPTIALNNTVGYNALYSVGLDPIKDFPPLRVWGTVGFIAAMWAVDLLGFSQSYYQLWVSAGLSLVACCFAFTMPKCPLKPVLEEQSWVEKLGLKAFSLFKRKEMAVFFIFSMLLGMCLQITNTFADGYIKDFGKVAEYADTFGVKHSVMLISLSQISEALCILLIPFFLKKLGIKKVMLISMFAWVFRFAFLGAGNPGSGVWLFVISMIVYGVAFDFFNISGALFVEKETDKSISASAQGVFMMMTNGFGAFVGSYLAGLVVQSIGWPVSWYIFAGYALVVGVLFAILFKDPEKIKKAA